MKRVLGPQQSVQAEVLQSEKANTDLGPGNKGHERMSVYFENDLFNYRHLSWPEPIEGGTQLVPGTQLDNHQINAKVDLKTEQTPQLKGKKRVPGWPSWLSDCLRLRS